MYMLINSCNDVGERQTLVCFDSGDSYGKVYFQLALRSAVGSAVTQADSRWNEVSKSSFIMLFTISSMSLG